ncbi:cilia- and flagella-associated protein 54 isoform X3 [Carassius auratus]|uniref:Cilia- and flagella-associated protein 54 isoform X3 n=1 Tax=Carassius auratus TaxID=7957 RepID=A0A6P6K042_CARAU|nr:cilia- and flagella-associated protein 54 isoform X3 [Carassius auratus]
MPRESASPRHIHSNGRKHNNSASRLSRAVWTMDPAPASYYGPLDKNNPVLSSFQSDLKEFKAHIKKLSSSPNYDYRSYSRGSTKLFETWNKYKSRLPPSYFEEHLLQTADFLLNSKLYRLALWQGYRLYLQQFCTLSLESIRDVEHFRQSFFSDGFDSKRARLTFRALQGECQCIFYLEKDRGAIPDQSRVQNLLSILGFLRILMQAVLPDESLCWILYNGSLHMYNICRFLMSAGHASQVLEYLLWACTCLETSVPLLTAKFLPWRATLYCAVCKCYFHDCASVQAEVFARRALGKISELAKLEEMTGSQVSLETQQAFKEATIKLAVMVFKRSVYEPRRKPKGLFRPKQKSNLKELQQTPWPRTPTERILMEMFEGNAARFLAVLEALEDSSVRPLQTGMPEEFEVQDVVLELISAGTSLLSGFGDSDHTFDESLPPSVNAITPTSSLFDTAVAGKGEIAVDAAVKFVKQVFRYEQWSTFSLLSSALISALANMEGSTFRKYELELKILEAVEHLMSNQKVKFIMKDAAFDGPADKNIVPAIMTEEFFSLIQTLHACVCKTDKDIQPDADLVLDIVLFFWAKCKTVFQRARSRHYDPVRYLGRVANQDQWVETLLLLCEVAHEHQLAEVDFILVTEMTLRLAMVLENSADAPPQSGRKTASTEDSSQESIPVRKSASSLFMRSKIEQLQTALDLVERGVECVSRGRARSLYRGSAVFDEVFTQKFCDKSSKSNRVPESSSTSDLAALSMDLHLELLAFQHRLALKLSDSWSDEISLMEFKKSHANRVQASETIRPTGDSVVLEKIKKNKISKCVFLAQKALLAFRKNQMSQETKKILEEATMLMEKAELEERRLLSCAFPSDNHLEMAVKRQPPPAPIVLSRSNRSMTFKPAPYALEDEVCWYCIYGREAEGVNLKVRLKDCCLCGTGDMTPARGGHLFHVDGLEPDKKYIFAVAAFNAKGKLVGGAIGETTRPLLASLPLPLLTTWAHIAQVAYQTGLYSLAKRACNELWSHFTLPPSPEAEQEGCLEGLAQTRLHPKTLQLSSPLLQQLFFSTIFIQTDIHILEGALFCDSLCDGGPLIWGQEARLAECERMLVAIDLALHLSDTGGALQAVVSCYGLLTPLIFNQIPSEPGIEVLLKCFTVLLEIPEVLKQKRPVATTESLEHMVACLTYYLAKVVVTYCSPVKKDSLRSTQGSHMASSVFELGMRLLQEITEPSQQPAKKTSSVELDGKKTAASHDEGPSEQLKVLEVMKTRITETLGNRDVTSCNKTGSDGCELTGQEDPVVLYMVIENSPLQHAFKEVMKFKQKSCFLEFVVHLLKKALLEDELDPVLQWEQDIFNWLSRRDEALFGLKKHSGLPGEEFKDFTASVIEYNTKKQKDGTFWDGRKLLQKKLLIAFKSQNSEREVRAVDILLSKLAALIRRHQRCWKLRQMRSEDSLWRCHVNLSLACAHLGLLKRNLGPPPKLCFSHLSQSFFSLAHCGMLILWKNVPQHIRPPELTLPNPKAVPRPTSRAHTKAVEHKVKDTNQGEPNTSDEEFSSADSDVEDEADFRHTRDSKAVSAPAHQTPSQLLDTLNKASVHMRRAMVLAHRWGHWTTLQWACRTLWDQSSTLALMLEHAQGPVAHARRLTIEQLYTVITPLLVLASDLLMDMMEKLKLWNVYDDQDAELEASLHFSSPMDDGTVIDLRWLRTLVLHTLELLYYQAKWENLAHLALIFNTYTRQRYSHMVTPVLVHAQRRLLDRISCFGGPPAPQPHFTYTEMISGEKVTCRNYASRLLLFPCGRGPIMITAKDSEPKPKELADVKRAMCLVCVPLDVEDTLHCFRDTLEKRNHTLLTFQHSRTLLLLLLADTQHSYVEVPFSKEPSGVLQGKVEFSIAASTLPGISPPDFSAEDFSSLGSIYTTTLPPSQLQTVFSSYNNAIKYLQANKYNSLQVQALHDLGNLHFYNGNRKSAHAFWSKALDCALQSSGVLESWDGDSWGSSSSQDTLQHAGIWGCLQGALLSAKIAQHILTSNIDLRTKCCLLCGKLFKCLLMASMPHPMTDLAYSTYSVETELIPGIDLFSEPNRGNLGSTVASLSFLCHWLYTSGHLIKVLPVLALYLYVARTVCRDLHLTVTCRILKVKVLTELGAFTEACKELSSLTFGKEIPVPHGCLRTEKPFWAKEIFTEGKPLLDPSNLQVLDEVVSRRPSKDIMALYGSRLTRRILMARVHLILAICSTIHDLPEPLTTESSQEKSSSTSCLPDVSSSDNSKGLQLSARKLTLGEVKAILLKEAHALVSPELFTPDPLSTDPEEMELAVEIRLLMSNINMQQGRMAASADLSVSALRLLQGSPVFQSDFRPLPPPGPPSSAFRRPRAKAQQTSSGDAKSVLSLNSGGVPEEVEARERTDLLFWLRCRLAVVRSLVGHIPGTAICSGADSSAEALRLLKEGLEEAEAWGDPDSKALLLLQGVQLNTHRGRPREDSTSMLQEIVSLLSGRNALSLRSQMTLAEAALLLSELRGTGSQTLHLLTQKLLQQQLCAFGESIGLKKGGEVELLAGLKNIYLPQLPLLARTTMRIGHSLALQALSSSSEGGEEPWRPLISAQEVLQSALSISQASANRDRQLEADILYCTGVVGRHLISMQKSDPQKVLEAFFGCLTTFNCTFSQSLRLTHKCYLEMALIYLQECEQITPPPKHQTPPPSPTHDESSKETVRETYPLLSWICLRMALKTSEVIGKCGHSHGFTHVTEGPVPLSATKALPDFALNDLFHPCGGLENPENCVTNPEAFMDAEHEINRRKCPQLTWVHMSRYYMHLINLLQVSSQPGAVQGVDGLLSMSGDPKLALRLSQLHTFFSRHQPSYRDQWAVPDPPADVILRPQRIQPCQHGQPLSDLYPWASTDIQELIIQWYRPTSENNTILLLFAVNNAPLSAMSPTADVVAVLQAGQRAICLDRLKAVHALLSSTCEEVDGHVSPSTNSAASFSPQEEKEQKISTSTPHRQEKFLEKTTCICSEIQNLLKPDFNSATITEMPFDPSMQTLPNLERCFNPATGGTLQDTAIITWLLSLLR